MKTTINILFIILGITIGNSQSNQNSSYTGNNFSLEGALTIFKKSNSVEEFEKIINQEDSNVNNLDLNNDGKIDYINVTDIQENNTHVIVISTMLNETEKQDIATIGIEKNGENLATLQIEGDENLYPENTIIEPYETSNKIENSKGGPNIPEISMTQILVNVWFWPCVKFIYAPSYVAWVSPHRWGFYPRWWRPWRPYSYNLFRPRCAPFAVSFRHADARNVFVARRIYAPRRRFSRMIINPRRISVPGNMRRGRGRRR